MFKKSVVLVALLLSLFAGNALAAVPYSIASINVAEYHVAGEPTSDLRVTFSYPKPYGSVVGFNVYLDGKVQGSRVNRYHTTLYKRTTGFYSYTMFDVPRGVHCVKVTVVNNLMQESTPTQQCLYVGSNY